MVHVVFDLQRMREEDAGLPGAESAGSGAAGDLRRTLSSFLALAAGSGGLGGQVGEVCLAGTLDVGSASAKPFPIRSGWLTGRRVFVTCA